MTIIEQIKAEIERLQKYNHCMADNAINSNMRNFYDGEEDCCKQLLSFLSTIEESERPEPYNPVYDEAYLNEKIKKATESWKGVDVDAMLAECRGYDLEEEIDRLWESFADEMEGPHNLFDIYARLARHFAQWGAEHLKK